jgi:hypothetical protein
MSKDRLPIEILAYNHVKQVDETERATYDWQARRLDDLWKFDRDMGQHIVMHRKLWIRRVEVKSGSCDISSIDKLNLVFPPVGLPVPKSQLSSSPSM